VHAEDLGRACLVALRLVERAFDQGFFEDADIRFQAVLKRRQPRTED
jgi:hypothetical protein